MTRGSGICATDQTVDSVSLVDPTSSQDDTPGAQVDTPPPPSLTTPTLPPMSNRSCRTHKDKGKSQGKRDSRGRGGNEAAGRASEQGAAARGLGRGAMDQTTSSEGLAAMPSSQDNNSTDDDDQDAHVKPQEPTSRCQTAIEKAADTVNPDVKDVPSIFVHNVLPSSSAAAKPVPISSISKLTMTGSDDIDPGPTNVKIPKPQAFSGNKSVFTDWLQHVQMYFSFHSNCTEKEHILITLSLMNQGYANIWSSAYYQKEEAKYEFVCALKESFAPINETGLAHTRLRELKQGNTLTDQFVTMFEQLMVEAGYSTARNNSTDADHLIDILKVNANRVIVQAVEDYDDMFSSHDFNLWMEKLRRRGKALEARNNGRVPSTSSSVSTCAPPVFPRYAPSPMTAAPTPSTVTQPTIANAPTVPRDQRDSMGVTYGGQGQPMDVDRQ
ncbi:hypothetical protein PAXINDRAFT_17178 [Paxillus involutus ATCC 200175]|uniref:Retrotransposon gag domain-containing protein n=1 Tax=Paxillus involutus ATCC 200175 TaxID=664439 RepID=A0A0C9TFW8_PAXIN|nr:hypothetical protein PAXINDRAFT_17178 [Paxillus involutus ATCC 200175]